MHFSGYETTKENHEKLPLKQQLNHLYSSNNNNNKVRFQKICFFLFSKHLIFSFYVEILTDWLLEYKRKYHEEQQKMKEKDQIERIERQRKYLKRLRESEFEDLTNIQKSVCKIETFSFNLSSFSSPLHSFIVIND